MIRLKARDGEVRVFDEADTRPVPVGKTDVYWAASDLYRVWLSQQDMAKLRNSEIKVRGRKLMEWAID